MRSRTFLMPGETVKEQEVQVIALHTQRNGIMCAKQVVVNVPLLKEEIKRYRDRQRVIGAGILRSIPDFGYIILDKRNGIAHYINEGEPEKSCTTQDEEYEMLEMLAYEYGNVANTLSKSLEKEEDLKCNIKRDKEIDTQIRKFNSYVRRKSTEPMLLFLNNKEIRDCYYVSAKMIYNVKSVVTTLIKVLGEEVKYVIIDNSENDIIIETRGNETLKLTTTDRVGNEIRNCVRSGDCARSK